MKKKVKKIIETKKEMVSEHKHLVKVMKGAKGAEGKKQKSALLSEIKKQSKELKGYERA